MNEDYSKPNSQHYGSEECVIVMVVLTILAGFISMGPSSIMFFSIVIALGLSTIAIAILHLAKVLQNHNE